MRRRLRWRLWRCFAFYIKLSHYTRLIDTELKSILDDFGIVTSFIMAHEVSRTSLNSSHLTSVDQLMHMKATNRTLRASRRHQPCSWPAWLVMKFANSDASQRRVEKWIFVHLDQCGQFIPVRLSQSR